MDYSAELDRPVPEARNASLAPGNFVSDFPCNETAAQGSRLWTDPFSSQNGRQGQTLAYHRSRVVLVLQQARNTETAHTLNGVAMLKSMPQ
jgi:hypothetical protein